MLTKIQNKVITVLMNTTTVQCRDGVLGLPTGERCALGVIADEVLKLRSQVIDSPHHGQVVEFSDCGIGHLSDYAVNRIGLANDIGTLRKPWKFKEKRKWAKSISEANDKGMSLREIGERIKADPDNVFYEMEPPPPPTDTMPIETREEAERLDDEYDKARKAKKFDKQTKGLPSEIVDFVKGK